MISLFIAGVAVPSSLGSGTATNHAVAVGSLRALHALTIGRVTFSYTLQNLASAILRGFFGSLIALAIEIPDHGRQEIQKFAYVSASA